MPEPTRSPDGTLSGHVWRHLFDIFMPRFLYIIWVFAAILLSACGRTPESEPVAVVAGKPIDAEEYRTRYVDFLLASGLPDEAGRRAAYLERLVTMKLMAHDVIEGGLAEEPVYRFAEERTRRKLLMDAWMHRAVHDTITVSEQDLQDMFVRVNTTVTARTCMRPPGRRPIRCTNGSGGAPRLKHWRKKRSPTRRWPAAAGISAPSVSTKWTLLSRKSHSPLRPAISVGLSARLRGIRSYRSRTASRSPS